MFWWTADSGLGSASAPDNTQGSPNTPLYMHSLLPVGGVLLHEPNVRDELVDTSLLIPVLLHVCQPLLLHPGLLVVAVAGGAAKASLGILGAAGPGGGIVGILVAVAAVARVGGAADDLLPVRAGGGGGGWCGSLYRWDACAGAGGERSAQAENRRRETAERHCLFATSP